MTSSPLQPSGERRLNWLLLALALGASVWLARRAQRQPRASLDAVDLISVVPQGPELLLTADVAQLSPAVAVELLRAGGSALLGLRELCGFEPLLGLRRVALVMPFRDQAGPGEADFALIAETSLEPEPVLRCAEAVMRKRGGQPVRSSLGRFSSVRDQQKPLGEVAMRGDGLFVLSGGQYFRDVLDAANGAPLGDQQARLRSQVHAGIRRRLLPGQIVLTLLPGPGLRLPGVRALGLGLNLQSELLLRGFVGCASAPACVEARQMIDQLRTESARELGLSGLESLRSVQHDVELDVSARLPKEQLGPLLVQLLSP